MKKISIVIVNYNSGSFLYKCLSSIITFVKVDYEVIVVDNYSSDNSIELCHDFFEEDNLVLIQLDDNLGFAKANNIGVAACTGDIIHFLNPDTELRAEIDKDYILVNENPDVVYINDLENLDGTLVQSKNLIPTLKNCWYKLVHKSVCTYWYTGATVIISKENFEKIGKWNEHYFMYAEDMDLFYQINQQGIKIQKLSSVITHVGGASSSRVWSNLDCEIVKHKSFKRFYSINGIGWQYHIISVLIVLYQFFRSPRYAQFLFKVYLRSQ